MKTKVRKKKDVEEMYAERDQRRQEKLEERESWHRFWEKDSPVNHKKLKKGGFKRPKSFSFDNEDLVKEELENSKIENEPRKRGKRDKGDKRNARSSRGARGTRGKR